ncbi:MAG: hypothetical protein KDD60_06355 [Bdellovibrionales bacterium]|nr:hypothetical protein [Bdellovibrionales bacterium]
MTVEVPRVAVMSLLVKKVYVIKRKQAMVKVFGYLGMSLVGLGALTGCMGGSTETDQADLSGAFVATDSTVGTIRIKLNESRMNVSETSGFLVSVRNQDGAPVERISVSCDTEAGLALLEPSLGRELTDSNGNMSGILGCERPGSFQMACRLPIGSNLRTFVDVVCEGDVPAGFSGFGGSAGGGGLNGGSGGVSVGDDGAPGGAGTEGIRITRISVYDQGEVSGGGTTSVDTASHICSSSDDATCVDDGETLFDSHVEFTILNDSNKAIRLTGFNFTVPSANGTGTATFDSKTIQFASSLEVPAFGGEESFYGLFLDVVANTSAGCGIGKRFPDSSSAIPINLGFRTITFTVYGTNELGEEIAVKGTTTLSFFDVDRC